MAKVEARGLMKSFGKDVELTLFGSRRKIAEAATKFKLKPGDEMVVIVEISTEKKAYKSRPMLGYLYGHLAPLLQDHLRSIGWNIHTKESAIEFIKESMDFVVWHTNENTGEQYKEKLSLATAPKDKVQSFIEDVFILLHTEAAVKPLTPEGYRSQKNKKL